MLYEPYSKQLQEDPFPAYRHFLENEPCAYNPEMDIYALFRFEDVWNATLDWKTFSSRLGPLLENRGEISGETFSIIGMDPPRHVRFRTLIAKGFTPRRIAVLEREVRAIARRLLDAFVKQGGGELQEAFSRRLPMDVISALLGIPEEERDEFRHGTDLFLARDPVTGAPHPDAGAARERDEAMLQRLLEQRRREPRDDLITILASSELDDVDGSSRRLTDDEMGSFVFLLASAGYETTMKLIGNCVVYLAEEPEQRQQLWDDPSLIPQAVEEVLRYDAPSQFQGRVCQRDVDFDGVTIPKDARVALVTGAAGRDPREFDDPDRLDIHRVADRQLYFGHGHHVCIGKSLARLEAQIALEEIAARFPDYRVDESGLTRTYQAHVRGFDTVPVQI